MEAYLCTHCHYDPANCQSFKEVAAPDVSIGRLMGLNAREWPLILIGCLAAVFNGAKDPIVAVVIAEMLGVNNSFHSATTVYAQLRGFVPKNTASMVQRGAQWGPGIWLWLGCVIALGGK